MRIGDDRIKGMLAAARNLFLQDSSLLPLVGMTELMLLENILQADIEQPVVTVEILWFAIKPGEQ